MKKKTIRMSDLNKKVNINTEIPDKLDSVFDSKEFDSIPVELIQKIFIKKYGEHKAAILNLALSRLAFGTALSNVEASIKDAMEEAIILDTDKTRESLDVGFTLAMITQGYSDAFSFITDEEVRKEIILTLITGKKLTNAKQKGPVGYIKGSEGVEKDLEEIKKHVSNKLEKDTDSMYGNVSGSKVGILGRRKTD